MLQTTNIFSVPGRPEAVFPVPYPEISFHEKLFLTIAFVGCMVVTCSATGLSDTAALLGRWDLTVYMGARVVPSWFEVIKSGTRMLVGRFVGGGGSARPVSRYYFADGKMSFSIPPQWERQDRDLSVEGHFQGDSLVGTMVVPSGQSYNWVGYRAPALQRAADPAWGWVLGVDLRWQNAVRLACVGQ